MMKQSDGKTARAPYGLELVESCLECSERAPHAFCDLAESALRAFGSVRFTTTYPKGAILFLERQSVRGVYLLCSGCVKLSMNSADGRELIARIAERGEALGLSSTVSGRPYELTAETLEPCRITFIKREDFLRLLNSDAEISVRTALHLSNNYHLACEQIRLLALSNSAGARLAKFLLEWCLSHGQQTPQGHKLILTLTHEEIAHLIGVARDSEFRHQRIIQTRGASLLILKKAALEALAKG
jgi:CRP/FNR family transcriptional regulator, cyclic AMP receptor protein